MGDYDSRSGKWCLNVLVFMVLMAITQAGNIPITILQSAKTSGAVCLDGSPPAYHLEKGSGTGIDNWLVHMEGGGWCDDMESCMERKDTYKGSSLKMEKTMGFSGILGSKQAANPDFYNWNRIKIKYCDGSSFTGDVEAVDPKTNLHFRGERVWRAVIDDLLAKGMKSAKNAILSGCSAGGLASILHCDKFKALLPPSARVKCVSDAGYFIHGMDVAKGFEIGNFFGRVVALHGSAKTLPASCTSKNKPELCFFPQYVAQTMQTPLFVLNSAYDSWQIKNILAPSAVDKKGSWKACKLDLKKCSPNQLQFVQAYRAEFLNALNSGAGSKPGNGYFINSCYAHCQSGSAAVWLADKSPVVSNTKIGKAIGDWFYDREVTRKIDCPYPCNPTCVKVDSDS
ncbi:Pectinacetylesterase family protein [Euphorbia peplus]|nr:Pectinacetylesterase family protein [Euphorbia peplus]